MQLNTNELLRRAVQTTEDDLFEINFPNNPVCKSENILYWFIECWALIRTSGFDEATKDILCQWVNDRERN